MKAFTIKTVHSGKCHTVDQVKKRLQGIATNTKSAYYKAYQEGRLQVHYLASKQSRHTAKYQIVMVEDYVLPGTSECGECGKTYFGVEDDYLCEECRSAIEERR